MGIYKVLKRLGFSRKQALNFIRSPDTEYRAKWQRILAAYQDAWNHPEKVVLLFLDELTYYRQPTKSQSWHCRGKSQPKAQQSPRYNTQTRVVAVLNAMTGQVDYLQRTTGALIDFYAQLRAAYPDFPTLTAVENVQFALDVCGRSHVRDTAVSVLHSVGLSERLTHFPHELSSGEQQRVAIARALATDNPLLLADGPTGELDFQTGSLLSGYYEFFPDCFL